MSSPGIADESSTLAPLPAGESVFEVRTSDGAYLLPMRRRSSHEARRDASVLFGLPTQQVVAEPLQIRDS